jgi:hypothetical protein
MSPEPRRASAGLDVPTRPSLISKRFHDAGESERETFDNELEVINRQQILDQVLPIVRARTSSTVWRCFELRVLNYRPAAAIAGELGISTNAVYVCASRVLKSIRK